MPAPAFAASTASARSALFKASPRFRARMSHSAASGFMDSARKRLPSKPSAQAPNRWRCRASACTMSQLKVLHKSLSSAAASLLPLSSKQTAQEHQVEG